MGLRYLFWWLVPLAGLILVLVTSYQAVTTRWFENANGVTGELLAGKSAGQSFVARYDNLSGVELHLGTYVTGTGPAKASLVFHLKEVSGGQGGSPQKDPAAGPDLATARLAAGSPLTENAWYLFSFPPIPNSQDRTFYVVVESPDGAPGHALTFYWWRRDSGTPKGDPYAYGTAYLNGQPQRGDLAFGLHYEPSPMSAVAQVGRAISTNLPGSAMLLLFGGAIVALGALFYLLIALREPARRRRWLRRWSLPFVLGVALLSGLLYLFLVPPWQGPDEHAHFAYTALLDHYNLDYAKVETVFLQRQAPDKALTAAINASMARHDFTSFFRGDPEPGAPPDAGATLYSALSKPPTYYWLGAVALRLARFLGIDANPYTNPDVSLLVLRALSLALDMVVVVLAWLAARIISGQWAVGSGQKDLVPPQSTGSTMGGLPGTERSGITAHCPLPADSSWLILLLPLTVALLPMHTFDTTMFNNDVSAEVAASALFVVLAALLRWPSGWRAVGLAVLAVLLAAGGLFTKSTADAALPMLAAGLLVWVGLLVTRALNRRGIRPLLVPGVMIGLLALLGIGSLLVAYEPQNQTAGWVTTWVPLRPMPRTETPTAHDGHYVLELGPKGRQATLARQILLPPVYHPVMTATVSGWVRTAPGAGKPLVQSPTAVLMIGLNSTQASHSDVPLNTSGAWQPISATTHVAEGTQQLMLLVTSAYQRAQFDDFTLQIDEGPVVWHDPIFQPRVVNPSAESGFIGLKPELARLLPANVVAVANVLPNPQPFDKLALWGSYANGQYTSFWGNFGWLSIPLPDSLYIALAIVSLLGLAGLVYCGIRNVEFGIRNNGHGTTKTGRSPRLAKIAMADRDPNSEFRIPHSEFDVVGWLGVVALFSLVATIVVSYAWQTMLLATQNQTALLSGRYLFVLIVPIAWLLLVGLDAVSAFLRSLFRRAGAQNTSSEGRLPWSVWLYCTGLMLFAAYCLLTLIIPNYYA